MIRGLCRLSPLQHIFIQQCRHDSVKVMKHILRDGGGLKAAETKHAGSGLVMQAGGWQSFNPHRSADKSACKFHFYPLTSLLGS